MKAKNQFLLLSCKKERSFTLLEALFYIVLSSIIMLVAVNVSVNVFFGKAKIVAITEVNQNGRFVMEKIVETIREAESITRPIQGVTDSSLSLVMADSLKNPTNFDLAAGIVRIEEGGRPPVFLNSNEVSVSDLQFSNISYDNAPGTIRITLKIRYNNPENQQHYEFEKTFYTTANIREKP